jgi:hypothetical protein
LPESVNITEEFQNMGQTAQEYKDAVVSQFKDMEVDLKDWNFSVGKMEDEYTVEVTLNWVSAKRNPKRPTVPPFLAIYRYVRVWFQ